MNKKRQDKRKGYVENVRKVSYEEYERARKTYERDQLRIAANEKRKELIESIFSNKVFLDAIHFMAMIGWFFALLTACVLVLSWLDCF